MSEGLDFNIDNYELQDLLNLFKLDYNFSKDDLKQAKKIVLGTHPDKSNLPKEYFLFFCSAYKVVNSIYQFRSRGNSQSSTEYYADEYRDEEKERMLKHLANKPNFNKIFNELFEKHRIKDEYSEGGYGDWLKSNEDIDTTVTTKNEMHNAIEKKKSKARALIVKRDIVELGGDGNGQSDLVSQIPESYGSALFSDLGYEDLRKAHVETVIPVTQEDLNSRPTFYNEEELRNFRNTQNSKPMSLDQAHQHLNQRNEGEGKNDVLRAFKLAKQDEESRRANDNMMSVFKRIGY